LIFSKENSEIYLKNGKNLSKSVCVVDFEAAKSQEKTYTNNGHEPFDLIGFKGRDLKSYYRTVVILDKDPSQSQIPRLVGRGSQFP
jgi:hypothetical protein